MRTKYSDLVARIFMTAVIVVLTGLLIAWMTGVFKDKKQDLNAGKEKIDQAINSMADFDLLVYDGDQISGKSLTELISDFETKDVYVSIWVHTLSNSDMYYNYGFTDSTKALGSSNKTKPTTDKTVSSYITPSGNFLGEVIKNSNNEIVCIKFTQQFN